MTQLPPKMFALIFLLILRAVFAGEITAGELKSRRAALNTIKSTELKSHVSLLADDTLEGREAGSRGGQAAAKYLIQFLSTRTRPAGTQTSHAQYFNRGFQNIVGIIPGSDAELADEFVLVGAHYDHVGYGTRQNSNGPVGYIHNGADDNASGTSSLLELVDAFSQLEVAPRRSIIFAFWDAEEKGLLGSEHWAANPSVPLHKIKLAFNMDMVGRLTDNTVQCLGTRTGVGFRQLTSRANTEQMNLDFMWKLDDNSDHHTFFRRNIPVLMLHTGLHSDYHRPSDDVHLINDDGIKKITRLAFNILFDAANAPSLPNVRSESQFETEDRRARFESPIAQPAPRLGLSWRIVARDPNSEETDSTTTDSNASEILVVSVSEGTPAAFSGFEIGDQIIAVNGVEASTSAELRAAVIRAPIASTFEVLRPGESEPATIEVQLQGEPIRLGISWRQNPAELGTVAVVRVVKGSAAERAGLQLGDRIWEINEQTFDNSKTFHEFVKDAVEGESLKFKVERNGNVAEVNVPLR
ncbi:M20/M25/M40 family metallo-hydrolase [Planctomycetota bacterium]